jgi:hypothetical protein
VTAQVLHADFITLNATATVAAKDALLEEAGSLSDLDEVVSVTVVEGESDSGVELALFFVLKEFTALEPFGTAGRYSGFLQGRVAPLLRGLAGADVQLEHDFPAPAQNAACLAIAAPPETYDWEVRSLLSGWAGRLNAGSSTFGLAIGERQRFRGLAVTFSPAPLAMQPPQMARFGAMLITGKARAL